jgi:hypothetical protein
MDHGVEIFVTPSSEVDQRYAAITRFRMPLAAVNRYAVPARNQASGKFFGECLKPAIAGGNATCAENRDARHGRPGYRSHTVTAR